MLRYDEPLAKNVRGARFPVSVDKVLSQLDDQSTFIRSAVIEKLRQEGLLVDEPDQTK